ncbi:hypothetical protein QR680_016889 [Steinernema hermaphroditum]|uniref:G protein-coupled receptor n=1 Tax=Steinernema hermaphroditum TaxID=289476 RepID=A0AA39HCM1_9BILA|nr:hypothetical protein QR680_016889 [Steinernema hermaphroditum]
MARPSPVVTIPYLEYFELLLDVLAPFVNIYLLALLRRPFFHLNLRILLSQFSIGFICLTMSRVLLVVHAKKNFIPEVPHTMLHVFHDGLVFGIMDVSILISVERIFATVWAEKYEEMSRTWITIASTVVMWLLNTSFAYYIYVCVSREHKTREGSFTISKEADQIAAILTVVMALNFLGLLIFELVRRYNKKRWRLDLRNRLSHRYQIMENIRTSKQLQMFLLLDLFISAYFYGAIIRGLFILDSRNNMLSAVFSQVFDLISALSASILPCLCIRYSTHTETPYSMPAVLAVALKSAEFAFQLCGLLVNVYFLFLLRRPFFHLNLRIMLTSFSLGLICLTSTRMFVVVNEIVPYLREARSWIMIAHNSSIAMVMDATILMAGERILATVLVRRYEKVRFWLFSVVCAAGVWAFNVSFAYYMFHRRKMNLLQNVAGHDHFFAGVYISAIILNLLGVAMFLSIRRQNQNRWKIDLKKNLAHRYQIMENIRTSQQLSIVMAADVFVSVYFFSALYYLDIVGRGGVLSLFFGVSFDFVAALAAIFFPCVFMTSHRRMRGVVKRHLCLRRKNYAVNPSIKMISVKRSDSIVRAEANLYFKELERTWNMRK